MFALLYCNSTHVPCKCILKILSVSVKYLVDLKEVLLWCVQDEGWLASHRATSIAAPSSVRDAGQGC